MSKGNPKLSTSESEHFNGYADGSYEADHDGRPLTDEQLAELSKPYATGYREGYSNRGMEIEEEVGK